MFWKVCILFVHMCLITLHLCLKKCGVWVWRGGYSWVYTRWKTRYGVPRFFQA